MSLSTIKDMTVRACPSDLDPSVRQLHQWYTPDRIILLPQRFLGHPSYRNLTEDQIMELILSVHCMAERGIAYSPPVSNGRKNLRVRRVFL